MSKVFSFIYNSSSLRFDQGVCLCVWFLCVRRRSKYFKVVSDWLTLVAGCLEPYLLADLCGLSLMMS